MIKSQNLYANVKSEFLQIFENFHSISMSICKSQFLVRVPKKTNNQIKIEEYEKEKKQNEARIRVLEKDLDKLHSQLQYIININDEIIKIQKI